MITTWKQADHLVRIQLGAMGETPESMMPKGLNKSEFESEFLKGFPDCPPDELEKSWLAYSTGTDKPWMP